MKKKLLLLIEGPTGKCRRNEGNRKSPPDNYHRGVSFRWERSMDAKAGGWR